MTISVRLATQDDISPLARLRRAWNEEDAGAAIDDPTFEESFRAWWASERPGRTFFILESGGSPIGMANVMVYRRMPVAGRPHGGSWGYVGNVFVVAERRNAGVGRILMQELIAWAGSVGLDHLRLAPSPLSRSFYARLGFTAGAVVELDPPRAE